MSAGVCMFHGMSFVLYYFFYIVCVWLVRLGLWVRGEVCCCENGIGIHICVRVWDLDGFELYWLTHSLATAQSFHHSVSPLGSSSYRHMD